ncbi:type IV secretion system protein VirB5 [Bartonella sp. B35(2025)]
MKKYPLATLLLLSFISNAMSQTDLTADEYYKSVLESTQKLEAVKSETAESILASANKNAKQIEEISKQLEKAKPEELQTLQVKLAVLQANLQADALKLQSFAMIKAKDTKTKEEIREEEEQKKHQDIEEKLQEQLRKTDVRL